MIITQDKLLQKLESNDLDQQAIALLEIVDQNTKQAVPQIIPLLHSIDPSIRADAAEALGRLGKDEKKRVSEHLQKHFNDEEELVRSAIIEAFIDLDAVEIIPIIQERLLQDDSALVRASAAEALGYLPDPSSLNVLEQVLTNFDEDDSVRAYAANSLGLLGDQKMIAKIEQYLTQETALQVKAELLGAEYYLGLSQALKDLLKLLCNADESLAVSIFNILSDLTERKTLNDLGEEKENFIKVVQDVVQRFPILQGQANQLILDLS